MKDISWLHHSYKRKLLYMQNYVKSIKPKKTNIAPLINFNSIELLVVAELQSSCIVVNFDHSQLVTLIITLLGYYLNNESNTTSRCGCCIVTGDRRMALFRCPPKTFTASFKRGDSHCFGKYSARVLSSIGEDSVIGDKITHASRHSSWAKLRLCVSKYCH